MQNANNVIKDFFNSVINLHENMNLNYIIHNFFIKLFIIFIKKNLKTIVCMIKERKKFINVKIKQNLLFNIKKQKDKKYKILDFIEKKNKNKNNDLKKKSKFFFKNILKFSAMHF